MTPGGVGLSCAVPVVTERSKQHERHTPRAAGPRVGWSDMRRRFPPGLLGGGGDSDFDPPQCGEQRSKDHRGRTECRSPLDDPPSGVRRVAMTLMTNPQTVRVREKVEDGGGACDARRSSRNTTRGPTEQHSCMVPPLPRVATIASFHLDPCDKVVLCAQGKDHSEFMDRLQQVVLWAQDKDHLEFMDRLQRVEDCTPEELWLSSSSCAPECVSPGS